jgi:hypothetical protein
VSLAVAKLRLILSENEKKDNVFGRVVNGSLPLVVDVQNKVSSVIFRDYALLIL